MKTMKIVTCLMLAVSVLCVCTAALLSNDPIPASEPLYPEPENVSTPDGVVWNAELGEYYNADSFTWNSETKSYEVKVSEVAVAASVANVPSTDEEWYAKYSGDNDPITEALIEYDRTYKEFFKENPALLASSIPQYCDEAWDALISLGEDSVPAILQRIAEDPYRAPILNSAIEKITG